MPPPADALGILEVTGLTPAMVALDRMEKGAGIRVVQAELNDWLGYVLKVTGSASDVQTAIELGRQTAEEMGGKPKGLVINRPSPAAWPGIESKPEFNPTMQQDVVFEPSDETAAKGGTRTVADNPSYALGFIETQGFTAVFEAIDSACKAANVEVLGKEKLGGGYITVVIRGDVAAVRAAIDAGASKVGALGKLIAGHVIARPSPAVLALLPK
jgi:carbon dioxide concentrating mechanism protein CcmO